MIIVKSASLAPAGKPVAPVKPAGRRTTGHAADLTRDAQRAGTRTRRSSGPWLTYFRRSEADASPPPGIGTLAAQRTGNPQEEVAKKAFPKAKTMDHTLMTTI